MKKTIILIMINCIMIFFSCVLAFKLNTEEKLVFTIWFGELHQDSQNIGDMYYATSIDDFEDNSPIEVWFGDNAIAFDLTDVDLNKNYLRLDPFNDKKDFSVSKIEVSYGGEDYLSFSGENWLEDYVDKANNIAYKIDGDAIVCSSDNNDPNFVMNKRFSLILYSAVWKHVVLPYIMFVLMIIIVGIIDLKITKTEKEVKRTKKFLYSRLLCIFIAAVLSLGVLSVYMLNYYKKYFKDVTIGQIIYHLHTPLEGTNISSNRGAIILGVLLVIGINIGLFVSNRKLKANNNKGLFFGHLQLAFH